MSRQLLFPGLVYCTVILKHQLFLAGVSQAKTPEVREGNVLGRAFVARDEGQAGRTAVPWRVPRPLLMQVKVAALAPPPPPPPTYALVKILTCILKSILSLSLPAVQALQDACLSLSFSECHRPPFTLKSFRMPLPWIPLTSPLPDVGVASTTPLYFIYLFD